MSSPPWKLSRLFLLIWVKSSVLGVTGSSNSSVVDMFTDAAVTGDAETVKALIEAGADPNLEDASIGGSILGYACGIGHPQVVKELLRAGAKVNVPDVNSLYPLHMAVCSGNVDVVKAVLKAGADVDAQNYRGQTALAYAAKGIGLDIVQALLDAGASVDIQDKRGVTPGCVAVKSGNLAMVYVMLKASDAWVSIPDNSYQLPRDVAKNEDILALLPKRSWWDEWERIVRTLEFQKAVGWSLASTLPLTGLLVYQQRFRADRGQTSVDNMDRPSFGAQQLAAKAVLSSSSRVSYALPYRLFEVWSATLLPVWTWGYVCAPPVTAVIMVLAYGVPSLCIVGIRRLLQHPALCVVAANSSVVLHPLAAQQKHLPFLLLRTAAIFPLLWFLDWLATYGLEYVQAVETPFSFWVNTKWEGTLGNLELATGGKLDLDCLLLPELAHMGVRDPKCEIEFQLHAKWLPLCMVLLALVLKCCCCCRQGQRPPSQSDIEAEVESARQTQRRIRSLAITFDKIAAQADPTDQLVWEKVGRAIEESTGASSQLAAPVPQEKFWRSPYFDFAMIVLDFLSDVYTMQNVFLHHHWWFGGILLAVLISSSLSQALTGNTPRALFEEARESERLGFRSARFKEMQQHEASWEALPSLAISVYAFWFSVTKPYQFVLSFGSLMLSMCGMAKCLYQKLDLELPHDFVSSEREELLATSADLE